MGAIAFADFLTFVIAHQRNVGVLGGGVVELALEVGLFWGGECQICATDDMGDVVQIVVNNNGELLGRDPGSTEDHKITDIFFQVMRYPAKDPVGYARLC